MPPSPRTGRAFRRLSSARGSEFVFQGWARVQETHGPGIGYILRQRQIFCIDG